MSTAIKQRIEINTFNRFKYYGNGFLTNVGVRPAGICTGYHTKERLLSDKPDIILSNLSDLKYKF